MARTKRKALAWKPRRSILLKDGPSLLFIDTETAPAISYHWRGMYDVKIIENIRRPMVISFAWMWQGEKRAQVASLRSFPGYKPGDMNNRALTRFMRRIIAKADICVGHNIVDFDDKVISTELWIHDLPPVPPQMFVDTLTVLRTRFKLISNTLNYACQIVGIGKKVPTGGFELWKRVEKGEAAAWAQMEFYNRMDVERLLVPLYYRTRAWVKNHPAMTPRDVACFACPTCQSEKLRAQGFRMMAGGKRQRYQCQDCGKWSTGQIVKRQLRLT